MRIKGSEEDAIDLIESGQGTLEAVKGALSPVVETKRARSQYGNDLTRRWQRLRYGAGAGKKAFSIVDPADGRRKMRPLSIMTPGEHVQAIMRLALLVRTGLAQISFLMADMRQRSVFEDHQGELTEAEISKARRIVDSVLAPFGYKRAA